jgi:hypothetical protein
VCRFGHVEHEALARHLYRRFQLHVTLRQQALRTARRSAEEVVKRRARHRQLGEYS